MFIGFFLQLRAARIPVSLREFLLLQEALEKGLAQFEIEDFYYLARAILVKSERHFDAFDRVFAACFDGAVSDLESAEDGFAVAEIPEDWLRRLAEEHLTEEEKAQIKSLGGWEKLMETLRERLETQKGRHQGGSKWIGTAGTSPFGAYGFNPEGVRIRQDRSRNRRAVKVWDRRDFKNLAGDVELGTRNIKIALRRVREFAREGAAEELDLAETISATARNAGFLDLKMIPERHNAAKVLLLLDVGGSMDDHVKFCEQLFSAARAEFKHLVQLYFHNCPYGALWKDAHFRTEDEVSITSLLNTYGPSWKLVFVGDASMSPYELAQPGGAISHWNAEPGKVCLQRLIQNYPQSVWLNPIDESRWTYTPTIRQIGELIEGRMFPVTLQGLDQAMRQLIH